MSDLSPTMPVCCVRDVTIRGIVGSAGLPAQCAVAMSWRVLLFTRAMTCSRHADQAQPLESSSDGLTGMHFR